MHRPIVAALVAALISACAAAASPAATHGSIKPVLRALQHLEHRAPLVTLATKRAPPGSRSPTGARASPSRHSTFVAVTKRRHRADMGARRLQLVAQARSHRACGLSWPVVGSIGACARRPRRSPTAVRWPGATPTSSPTSCS
jgi:hypothetical protein